MLQAPAGIYKSWMCASPHAKTSHGVRSWFHVEFGTWEVIQNMLKGFKRLHLVKNSTKELEQIQGISITEPHSDGSST